MKIVSVHPDARPHRQWMDVRNTPDPWAFHVPAESAVVEANGRTWSSPYPVIALFWPNRFSQVFVLLKEERTDYYCNIITPPVYDSEAAAIRFVDLALDVVMDADGPRLLDGDEFAAERMYMPHAWADAAMAAATDLMGLAARREGPFSLATERRWRAWAR